MSRNGSLSNQSDEIAHMRNHQPLPAPKEFARPDDYDVRVIRSATKFRVHLFVGRGHWERHETPGFRDAIETARAMQREYPTCGRAPMIYAINDAGDSAPCKGWDQLGL